jgi:two-component system, OmpR family, sensor histidine kinase CiaH
MMRFIDKRFITIFISVALSNILFMAVILLIFHLGVTEGYGGFNDNYSLKLILLSLPGMLVISYFISRFLLNHTLKPVLDVCEFQEKLLTNSTYELRSPLTSIRGNLEVSLRKGRTVEEYKKVIRLSLEETDRIIDSLKYLHLLSSSKLKLLELFNEQADLKMIVSERLHACMPRIRSKGIVLEVAELSDLICVCDESLIRQTIGNLLEKAVKYAPEGGLIKISSSRDLQNMHLTIENTYRDINKEELKRFSEPHSQNKSLLDRDIDGLEVGLSIARYIINSHHGDMKVQIKDDHLFSITISLPLNAVNCRDAWTYQKVEQRI